MKEKNSKTSRIVQTHASSTFFTFTPAVYGAFLPHQKNYFPIARTTGNAF